MNCARTKAFGRWLMTGLLVIGYSDTARAIDFEDNEVWRFADSGGNNAMCAQGGDIDNDGDTDVIVKYGQTGKIGWFENYGGCGEKWWTNACSARFTQICTSYGGYSMFVADMDGDDDFDVVASGPHPSISKTVPGWWENSSNGTSWSFHMIYDPVGTSSWVEPADIDDDGDMDVACAEWGKILWVELNDGAPVSTNVLDSPGTWNSWCAHPAQLDGDAELEIVGAWYYGSYINKQVVIYQIGGGTTVLSTNSLNGPWRVWCFDADGDDDLEVAVCASSVTKVWENTTNWPVLMNDTSGGAACLHSGDLDGDGDEELVAGDNYYDFTTMGWTNYDAGTLGTSWSTYTFDVIDVDGDEDLAAR